MTEQEYDEQIAPILAEVADKVISLGGSMVTRVEWERDEAGITHIGVTEESGAAQQMAWIAALCRGNIDKFYIEAAKRFDLTQTMVGHFFSRPDP